MTDARRPTLRNIAESLGLSTNTISRGLRGMPDISVATRKLIEAEAQRIGYVPNAQARSLVLGSTLTIALVITNPSNPFYAQLIHGIESHGRRHGYSLLLLVTEESEENEERAIQSVLQSSVDGALIVPVQGNEEHWNRLGSAGIPLVLVSRDLRDQAYDFVGVDHEQGAYEATRHALSTGARDIWVVEEDLPITTIAKRLAGFRTAMAEAGAAVPERSVLMVTTGRRGSVALPWQPEEAYRVARARLALGDVPDAIVVGNDYYALGVYKALAERGARIPEDVSVLGYGDYPFSAYLTPSLTTVQLPAYEVGIAAVDLLLARMRAEATSTPHKVLLRPTLVVRESSWHRPQGSS